MSGGNQNLKPFSRWILCIMVGGEKNVMSSDFFCFICGGMRNVAKILQPGALFF